MDGLVIKDLNQAIAICQNPKLYIKAQFSSCSNTQLQNHDTPPFLLGMVGGIVSIGAAMIGGMGLHLGGWVGLGTFLVGLGLSIGAGVAYWRSDKKKIAEKVIANSSLEVGVIRKVQGWTGHTNSKMLIEVVYPTNSGERALELTIKEESGSVMWKIGWEVPIFVNTSEVLVPVLPIPFPFPKGSIEKFKDPAFKGRTIEDEKMAAANYLNDVFASGLCEMPALQTAQTALNEALDLEGINEALDVISPKPLANAAALYLEGTKHFPSGFGLQPLLEAGRKD